MPLNSVLAYLGMMGVLIGGLGLAYEVAVPRNVATDSPAEITASVPAMPTTPPTSERSSWPLEPRHAAVPFHESMLELLTPPAPPPEPDVTVGVGAREAEPPPQVNVRERAQDRKKSKTASRPKGKQAEADDDEAMIEVEVRDQTGRPLRIERVPRERIERTARDEREPRQSERGYDGGERRGFGFPLFQLFGGGGDRW